MAHYRTVKVEIVKAELGDNGELPLARGTGRDGRVITYDLGEGLHKQLQKLGLSNEVTLCCIVYIRAHELKYFCSLSAR